MRQPRWSVQTRFFWPFFFLLRHLRNNLRAMIARMAWMFGGRNVAMDPLILGFGWQ